MFWGIALLVLRKARLITVASILGGIVAIGVVLLIPRQFKSSASLLSTGSSEAPGSSALRGLAGQFGVSLPLAGGDPLFSPAVLAAMISSDAVLGDVISDSLALDTSGVKLPIWVHLRIERQPNATVVERAIRDLRSRLDVSIAKETGAVRIQVVAESGRLAAALIEQMVEKLYRHQLGLKLDASRQQRVFVEERIRIQSAAMALAEARLAKFTRSNREYLQSPELRLEYARMEREVELQKQVLLTLAQSREEVILREANRVSPITLLESPRVPPYPESRRLILRGSLAALASGALTVILATTASVFRPVNSGSPAGQFIIELQSLMRAAFGVSRSSKLRTDR